MAVTAHKHWFTRVGAALLVLTLLLLPSIGIGNSDAQAGDAFDPWQGFDDLGAPEERGNNAAPVGQGFTVTAEDLTFILDQINIAEQHSATFVAGFEAGTLDPNDPSQVCNGIVGPGLDQVPPNDPQSPFGLRVLDGSCNNISQLSNDARLSWGAADQPFTELIAPSFDAAENVTFDINGPAAPNLGDPTTYNQFTTTVEDSQPRVISNLIVDQNITNPAAVTAAGGTGNADPNGLLDIPNVAPDDGLSAPFNDMFTFFGQFFDHGLDLTTKSGSTVFMPLKADDPLVTGGAVGPNNSFMVLSRGQDGTAPLNRTTPYVDQNQTYSSHPSHQVFLREYSTSASGPVSTGRLIEGVTGGMATWDDVQAQATNILGFTLSDFDVHSVPLMATDPYGKFIPGPNGFPQMVKDNGAGGMILIEGNPAAPVNTIGAIATGHAFQLDISHHANPGTCDHDGNPATSEVSQTADTLAGTADDGLPCTFDDEMLGAHYMAGDGRANENIALTAVHHVFHSEHNRLVAQIPTILAGSDPASIPLWQTAGVYDGEKLFQAAKLITEMEYQHLAFEEFARKVSPFVHVFDAYDVDINAAISAEFAHAVYRFGHSMLNENVARFKADGTPDNLTLIEAFVNPPAFIDGYASSEEAAGAIFRGGTTQVGQEIDEFIVDALRDNLLGLPLDLGALNIARGRDNGLPTLNEFRLAFQAQNASLTAYPSWGEFEAELQNPTSIVNFLAAYGLHPSIVGATTLDGKRAAAELLVNNGPGAPVDRLDFFWSAGAWNAGNSGLNNIDLWVGGLAEKREVGGSMLGTTFDFIFKAQMEALQDGDRFYYLHRMAGTNLLTSLEGNSFSELVMRNTDVEGLPADVFSRPDFSFDLNAQDQVAPHTPPVANDPGTTYDESKLLVRQGNGTLWFGPTTIDRSDPVYAGVAGDEHTNWNGSPDADWIRASDGDDTIRGNDGNDRIEGDGGGDNIIGGNGNDIITDSAGDDDIKGGPGNDYIGGGPGADLLQGGPGADFMWGGQDEAEHLAGTGDDLIWGGNSAAGINGGEGDDWIEGNLGGDFVAADDDNPFDIAPRGGNDVIKGGGGDDRIHGEGGHDVIWWDSGLDRLEGLMGFDFVVMAELADLNVTLGAPPNVILDRYAQTEGISGTAGDDILNGDDVQPEATPLDTLDAEGIALYAGIDQILPPGATSFGAGNIILGGPGSDTLQGRGQNDILDGDRWMDVYLVDTGNGNTRYDSMLAMQASVLNGSLDPGLVDIQRVVNDAGAGGDTDTAVYRGNEAEYTVTLNGDGSVTVAHVAPVAEDDGIDTLWNMELIQFADNTIVAPMNTFECAVTNNPNGSATISWTDLGALGYDLAKDGGAPIWVTAASFIDVNPGTNYTVTAWGNGTAGNVTSCTNPNPGGGGFACSVVNFNDGSATISWTDLGAVGYDLAKDGGPAIWVTATTFTDINPGTTYSITAWGNGTNGNATSCTNPNPGGGGFTCSVANNANGSVTVSWTDLGALGYDLAKDGGPAIWVTATSFTDFNPGTSYSVTAWGNGTAGNVTSCTNPNPGGGGFTCSVGAPNVDGSVTITWTDLGATGYDLIEDGAPAIWVTGTVFVDSTPGGNYTVVSWGNGTDGNTTNC